MRPHPQSAVPIRRKRTQAALSARAATNWAYKSCVHTCAFVCLSIELLAPLNQDHPDPLLLLLQTSHQVGSPGKPASCSTNSCMTCPHQDVRDNRQHLHVTAGSCLLHSAESGSLSLMCGTAAAQARKRTPEGMSLLAQTAAATECAWTGMQRYGATT